MRTSLCRSLFSSLVIGTIGVAVAQGQSALLVGDVVSRETGFPLAHAMVTVLGAERQTFTSDAGVFAFSAIPPARYRLRVTRIGYVPAELNVEVPAGAAPPRVRVELTRLSVKLETVRVLATNVCTSPGRPDPDLNPDFAAIIVQLRLNAEHYQLLADSFPFSYQVERSQREMKSDSSRGTPRLDTLNLRTDHRGWTYKMGEMVERTPQGYVMHLPDLRDFASYEFLNNHCFRYAGLDSTRDGLVLRIDFRADVQIRTPDVNGAIFLDARTYQIRRADLELSKMPPEIRNITAVHVTTLFREISPAIVVIHDVNGINSLRHSRLPWSIVAQTEDQRMVHFEWLRDDPAHPPSQPER
ncbi:MAG: carboxypeptidase-like regulatory domain-containing protein [Gemmatimonadales bacterium]